MATEFLSIRRRMSGRDINEANRASTPLELLFDLTIVVAVAAAGGQLFHDVAAHHYARALTDLVVSFFAIWWSWMNFTWFSSAYDTDDIGQVLATIIQMVGVLVMAAGGITQDSGSQLAGAVGYTIIRVSAVGLWLRAAHDHPERRTTCRRYVLGLIVLQSLWLARILVLNSSWALPSFFVLVACELALPAWAERTGEIPWHPHHIAERFALFTIILLGECTAGAAEAIGSVLQTQGWSTELMIVSFSLVGLIVGLWATYFLIPFAQVLHLRRERAYIWAYGHAPVFLALAALDSLFGAIADVLGLQQPSARDSSVAISLTAISVAVFLGALWWLNYLTTRRTRSVHFILPALALASLAAVAVMLGLALPWGLLILTLSPVVVIAQVLHWRNQQSEHSHVK